MSNELTDNRTPRLVATRSPRELIQLYWDEVWNNGNAELIREICANPILRHDVGSVSCLTHEEQIARVHHGHDRLKPDFSHEVLVADDHFVSSVWNMTGKGDGGETIELCGIETFRAENGRFVECWNSPYSKGLWGRLEDSFPKSAQPPEILERIESIDPNWLQRMFRAADIHVPHIGLVDWEPVGNGTAAATYRVQITYNIAPGVDAPTTVIAKLPSPNRSDSADEGDLIGYQREVAAYLFFSASPPMRIPQCHYARSGTNARFSLILEDLGQHTRCGNQISGCSAADAELVVREIAKLHATYWNADAMDQLDWPLQLGKHGSAIASFYRRGLEILRGAPMYGLPSDALHVMEAVEPLIIPWLKSEVLRTLIHGELRVDNVIFEQPANGDPRACLIDFQQVGIGDPLRDLAYFLGGSLEPDARRACERRLVALHAEIVGAKNPAANAEQAWQSYRANAISGLVNTVAAAAVLPNNESTCALLGTLIHRNVATIIDLDGIMAADFRIQGASG